MNTQQNEIIEMAKQAGVDMSLGEHWSFFIEELEAFARLVAAKEREACAKVCDDIGMFHEVSQGSDLCFGLSKAIRARGVA